MAAFLQVSRASVYRRIDATAQYRLAAEVPLQELQTKLLDCGGDSAELSQSLLVSLSALRKRLRKLDLDWH